MLKNCFWVVCLMFLIAGCSNNADEKAAAAAFSQAQEQAQHLAAAPAMALYQAIIEKYPKQPQADQARQALAALERLQQDELQVQAGALLDRVATVLTGYKAFTGHLALTLKDLDAGGYMFDSQYLAAIVPEGADLYLSLNRGEKQTRMWIQLAGQTAAVSRDLNGGTLKSLTKADLQGLKSSWQEVGRAGRLTQVKL